MRQNPKLGLKAARVAVGSSQSALAACCKLLPSVFLPISATELQSSFSRKGISPLLLLGPEALCPLVGDLSPWHLWSLLESSGKACEVVQSSPVRSAAAGRTPGLAASGLEAQGWSEFFHGSWADPASWSRHSPSQHRWGHNCQQGLGSWHGGSQCLICICLAHRVVKLSRR